MEVKAFQKEYDTRHPNFNRWQGAREISDERAKFVEKIISNEILPKGLLILDIGAGEGGTSKLLSQNNFVVSLEPRPERIRKISSKDSLQPVMADTNKLPFKPGSFDLIILQDVIEHLKVSNELIEDWYGQLKENGIIYLSTPNRFSLFNIITDPHWGLPFLSLFKRDQIRKYFLKIFRKSDYQREDIAELLSMSNLYKLFGEKYLIKVYTKLSVKHLLNGGKGLIWSNFHLGLVKLVNLLGLKRLLINISNDEPGIINKFFTPTFYIIFKKK